MAKFMLDGQEYCGGGGSNQIVKLTQAEYDSLPNDKLSDGNIYLITDSGELTAENLFYDDTETQLGVNNVQDAIYELNSNLEVKNLGSLSKVNTNRTEISVLSGEVIRQGKKISIFISFTTTSDLNGDIWLIESTEIMPNPSIAYTISPRGMVMKGNEFVGFAVVAREIVGAKIQAYVGTAGQYTVIIEYFTD